MDPKLFAAAQQGLNMNNQQSNPNLMMSFQQQQQQQNQQQQIPQQPDMHNFNSLAGAGLGNVPFSPANLGGGMNFGQNDFGSLDQTDLSNINPFIQANPSLMSGMNVASLQQQPQQQNMRQTSHPQSVYSPQNLMGLQGSNSPAALQAQFQQNRNMFQGNGNMMPNTPQALMYQQQQQAAMAMNRAKQSPSQSPALNNAHFPGNTMGSPVIGNSPHLAGSRIGSDYAASPMNPNVGSPVQNFQGNGISPSPQMARVIPSQANNRYMQQMNIQQQQQHQQQQQLQQQQQAMLQQQQQGMNNASPSLHNPSIPSYGSPQHHQPQQQQQQLPQQQPQDLIEDQSKNYNAKMNFVQQSPMQQHSSPIPRQSATPGSTHSTPHQQHQQLDTSTPHMSPAVAVAQAAAVQTPNGKSTPMTPAGATATITTSPSPKPSTVPSETASPSVIIASTDQKNSPQLPKQQITYIPKTRNVETYGGVDLKYFDKFEIKPPVPHLNELGLIDIQALIMSLKSGMKMELTNALNVLTVLTVQPQIHAQQQQQPPHLPLQQCDDLLDVLLDYLEQDILGTNSRFPTVDNQNDGSLSQLRKGDEQHVLSDLTYTDLFDMSLDEMKSLIPQLENSTSDVWISLRERCLCIFNILRNLSFMGENMEYLARHPRFVKLLADIADSSRQISVLDGRDTTGKEAWFVGIRRMDTLDFRKSILMIFSNISIHLVLRQEKTAAVFVELTHDFLVNGPDTYYSLLAIETWTKLTVNYDNRQLLHSLVSKEPIFNLIQDIWLELTAVIRRDFFSADGRVMHAMTSNQLATLELTIIGLYNIVAIVQLESLKQQLVQKNKSIGMMIIRLSITLAESGNPQFGLATKRGMELIRSLVCGGDGIRRRNNRQQQQRPLEALSQYNTKDEKNEDNDQLSVSEIASRILDMPVVREKLMLSMLKPTTDPEILRELSDIVSLIDEDTTV